MEGNMALTPEQHSEIASGYESAARDRLVPPEQRAAFARKAELYRLLAKLAAKQLAAKQVASPQRRPLRQINPTDIRREIFENLARKQSGPSVKRAESETPAHIQALERLALRWRLFKLETRTFGRYAPLHPGRPTPANYRPPVFPHVPRG
jgi:hypothetical protein